MHSVTLPWPSKDLSPNSRIHWAKKHRAAKKARNDARIACLAADVRGLDWSAVRVTLTFHPPGNYRYDADNLIARCKSALDGISDAIGIDDRLWSFGEPAMAGKVKNGAVVVVLTPMEASGKSRELHHVMDA